MPNTTIQLKKSSTPSSVPADLANGELAINFADGKLFYKNTAGFIAQISGGGGNFFGTVNANSTLIVADTTGDILTIEAGSGIAIVGDAVNDKLTISATVGSNLSQLGDVQITSPNTGEFLVYNTGKWTNSNTLNHIIVPRFMGAMINLASSTSGANYVGNTIPFGSEVYDTDNFHDTVTNNSRITIPSGLGIKKVRLTATIRATTTITAGTDMFAAITKNGTNAYPGTAIVSHESPGFTNPGINISTGVVDVADGDYFELYYLISDTSSGLDANTTFFSIQVVETADGVVGKFDLNSISDVVVTAPSEGHVLRYEGGIWKNTADYARDTANASYNQANSANIIAIAAFNKANSTTYTSNVVISVSDNTNAALRITQTGNGHALLVEDSTNPDNTPIVFTANGEILVNSNTSVKGIFNTPGLVQIHTQSDSIPGPGAVYPSGLTLGSWADGTKHLASEIYFLRSRGNRVGEHVIVQDGDNLMYINAGGSDGTSIIGSAYILAEVEGIANTGYIPSRFVFGTTGSNGGGELILSANGVLSTKTFGDGANNQPIFEFIRDNEPVNGDEVGTIRFTNYDSNYNYETFGQISLVAENIEDGAEFSSFRFQTRGSNGLQENLRITANGNVGIGRTDPGYKLDVVGTVNASAVLVNGSPISGGSTVDVSSVAPGSPTANSLWWNSDEGKLYIYYNDGDSSQWVEASPTSYTVGSGIDVATLNGANTSVGAGANAYANLVWSRSNTYADGVGTAANSYLLAIIAGANTAVGTGANSYAATVGTGANNYLLTVIAGANTAVGAGANAFTSATIAGANTAVGTGANAFATAASTGANNYLLAVIAGANTAVGAGANAYANLVWSRSNTYADGVGTAANAYLLAVIAGANNAVGTGANAFTSATIAGANAAIGAGANAFTVATYDAANNTPVGNTLSGAFTSRSTRRTLNFIPGSNITINVDDDSAGNRANITITSTASGNGSSGTGSVAINSDAVNETRYLVFANNTSGNLVTANVTTGLTFNPSSNTLTINGALNAQTKSFVISHPTKEGMMLRYGSLEGPENGVYVRGKIEGKSIIELPEYWWNLIDEETITVNLTPYGRAQEIWVQSTSSRFIHLNQPADCFFTVFAERKDVDKLIVEY